MKNIINWKTFSILAGACALASLLVIPYQVALTPELADMGLSLYIGALVQGLVIFSVAAFLGLLLARKVGFDLPVFEGPDKWDRFMEVLRLSTIWGFGCGVLIVLGDLGFLGFSASLAHQEVNIPTWAALLASFYGGFAEEVLMRLFVMTLFIWLFSLARKTDKGSPASWGVWAAILLSNVLFGLGHLPATSALMEITGKIVARAIVLNSIGGVVYGWLYWKKGLASAMIAHFTTDIVIHIVAPAMARAFM
ncbi:MAG: CPBP family intramembrane metalloprotease [Clostridiales bacterium]|nr:CPBP family intramembrane metalloprotease [Clostridiales bacterium]